MWVISFSLLWEEGGGWSARKKRGGKEGSGLSLSERGSGRFERRGKNKQTKQTGLIGKGKSRRGQEKIICWL